MGTSIDKYSRVDSGAELGDGVVVGAFAIVEGGVVIGEGSKIHPQAVIRRGTKMGKGCEVHSGAVIGGEPQDTKFKGEESFLEIGDNTVVREHATLHRASGEGCVTRVGSGCMLMAGTHVGHNGKVGDRVVMANLATLGGFVEVGENAFVGGMAGAHQFVRIGAYVMAGGGSVILEDIPPYMMVTGGYRPPVCGLNRIGLMRAGFSEEARKAIHKAYRILYREAESTQEAVALMKERLGGSAEVQKLVAFLEAGTGRGFASCRRRDCGETRS